MAHSDLASLSQATYPSCALQAPSPACMLRRQYSRALRNFLSWCQMATMHTSQAYACAYAAAGYVTVCILRTARRLLLHACYGADNVRDTWSLNSQGRRYISNRPNPNQNHVLMTAPSQLTFIYTYPIYRKWQPKFWCFSWSTAVLAVLHVMLQRHQPVRGEIGSLRLPVACPPRKLFKYGPLRGRLP